VGSERNDSELHECWKMWGKWECFRVAWVLLLRVVSVGRCGDNGME
jgi:hypothetical protein